VKYAIRLFLADCVLAVAQSLARWAERLDHLFTRIDPPNRVPDPLLAEPEG
jgi:hypothetical protein